VHDVAPSKAIWFTECSGGSWSPDFATNLGWDSSTLLIGALQNWAETVLFWNIALDPNGGPHDGGCSNCRGVLTVDGDTVSRNVEFDELAELSSAVDPGAVRVASTPTVDGVESVAFVNPDRSRAIVIDNTWGTARMVTVSDGTGSPFTTAVPGGATLSLRWTD
jgi:glucosylceramidase